MTLHFFRRVLFKEFIADCPEPHRLAVAQREAVFVRRQSHEAGFTRHFLVQPAQVQQRARVKFVRRIMKRPGIVLGDFAGASRRRLLRPTRVR